MNCPNVWTSPSCDRTDHPKRPFSPATHLPVTAMLASTGGRRMKLVAAFQIVVGTAMLSLWCVLLWIH